MTETIHHNTMPTQPLCPDWRSIVQEGYLDSEEIEQNAADWNFCAVGEALGLAKLDLLHDVIEEALQETDEELHQLGHQFTDNIQDNNEAAAAGTLADIEEYIHDSGGPEAVLKSLKDYIAENYGGRA